jgi:hypothetical protein
MHDCPFDVTKSIRPEYRKAHANDALCSERVLIIEDCDRKPNTGAADRGEQRPCNLQTAIEIRGREGPKKTAVSLLRLQTQDTRSQRCLECRSRLAIPLF